MLKKIADKIDKFLLRFSYSFKAKFLIFISCLIAFLIAFNLFSTQRPFLLILSKQKAGIEEIKHIITFIQTNPEVEQLFKISHDESQAEQAHQLNLFVDTHLDVINSLPLNGDFAIALLGNSLQAVLVESLPAIVKIVKYTLNDIDKDLSKAEITVNRMLLSQQLNILADNFSIAYANNSYLQTLPETEQLKTSLDRYHTILSNVASSLDALNTSDKGTKETFKINAHKLFLENLTLANEYCDVINAVVNFQYQTLEFRQIAGFCIVISGISFVLLMYLSRVIRMPLANLKKSAEILADGNLTVRIPIDTKDEVADMSHAFNSMAGFLESLLSSAKQGTSNLVTITQDLLSTASELQKHANEQKDVIRAIVSNTREITHSVKQFSLSLQEINEATSLTSQLAAEGRKGLINMEAIMSQIIQASDNIVSSLTSLQEKVKNIHSIINTIVRLADQANLLSLNAALITNNTGLTTSGFISIVEEIRELADQTASVTLNIEDEVQEIVNALGNTVYSVGSFSSSIQNQVKNAETISDQLYNLIDSSQEQITAFDEINNGIQNQANDADEIQNTVMQLSNAGKETSRSMIKLTNKIDHLYQSVDSLQHMVNEFTCS